MKIVLSNPRGFCAGVEMAIRCLDVVVERLAPPIYVYHQLVHNRQVVNDFEDRGVVFVERVADVPYGATLVFSAHGVSPDVRLAARSRGLRIIDATCPLVAKVHTELIRFVSLGYQIVLIGHRGHDEIVGTIGEAPDHVVLVESVSDVGTLRLDPRRPIAYLTQTTLSLEETGRIVERLQVRYPEIVGPPKDDICYATQNRQMAVRQLATAADMVIVVGSQNSSNSRRLCEVAETWGPAHLIDDAAQLQERWFRSVQTVGITAGASAPEVSVQSVVAWLGARYKIDISELGDGEQHRAFPLPDEVIQLP